MNNKVLITGIDGFTGPYIEKVLMDKGYTVYGTVYGDDESEYRIACDMTDPSQVATVIEKIQPGCIIHLAAVSFVPHGNPIDFYNVNVIGAENLLKAVAGYCPGIQKLVMASSANVYGNGGDSPISEERCPAPVNHYGASKLAMEHLVKTYFDELPVIITRPFNYTGIGQPGHFVIPKIVEHVKNKKPVIELGNMEVRRDVSDVRDVADAYVALMESGMRSETVNICTGRTYGINEIFELTCSIGGHRPKLRVNPDFKRKADIPVLMGDGRKLQQTGWRPRYSLEDTLAWMLQS